MPAARTGSRSPRPARSSTAANIHFRPDDDRRLGPGGQAPEHQARRPALRPPRRGQGARRGSAPRPRRRPPAVALRGAPALTDVPPGPSRTPAWMQRLHDDRAAVCSGTGGSRAPGPCWTGSATSGGGLLAAGIAFNALFALIPLAIFASGVIGIFVQTRQLAGGHRRLPHRSGPAARELPRHGARRPGERVAPSLTIIGLIGAVWGDDAALRVGRARDRGDVHRASRRAASWPRPSDGPSSSWSSPASSRRPSCCDRGLDRPRQDRPATGLLAARPVVVLFVLPYALSILAILVVYLVVPPVRPPLSALWPPAIGAGVLIVAITQVFTLIAPRS